MKFRKKQAEDVDEKPRLRDRMLVTRRVTLLGAFASGAASIVGTGSVAANEQSNITVEGVSEGSTRYAQFENGSLSELQIDGETEFRVDDIGDLNGEEVIGAIDIAVNRNMDTTQAEEALENPSELSDLGGQGGVDSGLDDIEVVQTGWETVRKDKKIVGDDQSGSVVFEVQDMYSAGGENGHDHVDFSELSVIHDGKENGEHEYGNLGTEKPETGADFYGIPRNRNTFEVRFTIASDDGGLREEEIVEFTIDVTPELGFGRVFGTNFGRNHIEEWPSDWETA